MIQSLGFKIVYLRIVKFATMPLSETFQFLRNVEVVQEHQVPKIMHGERYRGLTYYAMEFVIVVEVRLTTFEVLQANEYEIREAVRQTLNFAKE